MSAQRCRLMLLVVLSAALLCNCFTIGGPARSFALVAARTAKIPRSIRAPFANPQMMTARGFGKRSQPGGGKFKELDEVPWSYHKSGADAKFYTDLMADGDSLDDILSDSSVGRFPIEFMASELTRHPEVIKTILRRFVDSNRDGYLTSAELLQQETQSTSGQTSSSPASAAMLETADSPDNY